MSTQPKFSHPSAFADRLFGRLTAIYGTQKMTAMWAGLVPSDAPAHVRDRAEAEVRATWTEALGDFHIDVVAAALRSLAIGDQMWPPSLPEFAKLCREEEERVKASNRLLALPAPSDLADPSSPAVQAFRSELSRFMRRHSSAPRIQDETEALDDELKAVAKFARPA